MIAPSSPMVRTGIQVATPLAVVVGIYLLFAGHNNPGGGFAAGLVFGAIVVLRSVADIQQPSRARELMAFGVLLVVIVAAAPLLWGDLVLDQAVVSTKVPLLGKVKSGSALPFDIGVTAIVVGLVMSLLDGLGQTGRGTDLDASDDRTEVAA